VEKESRLDAYWAEPQEKMLQYLQSGPKGLESQEAIRRLVLIKPEAENLFVSPSSFRLMWRQIQSPLVFILIVAALLSGVLGDWADALIILAIIFGSACISFWREYASERTLEKLANRLKLKSQVLRSGKEEQVPNDELVPGDVVLLSTGRLIPADCILLEAQNLFINQAVITGESLAVQKIPQASGLPLTTRLSDRSHCLYLGSTVHSGSGKAIVVRVAQDTVYGQLAQRLRQTPPETEFDRGLKHFGELLLWIMLLMVLLVFAAHAFQGRANGEALMFAVALAVGLSPELLPAILTINLASSAQRMAKLGVLVQRLNAIENLGSMTILCTDKTGTITEGVIQLQGAYDALGQASSDVLQAAYWNARLQAGMSNPLDDAILKAWLPEDALIKKKGEVPYDFVRKRLSVIVEDRGGFRMITKGAFEPLLAQCTQLPHGIPLDNEVEKRLKALFLSWSEQGFRVLGVAEKSMDVRDNYSRDDERGLTFLGFITFADQIKAGIEDTMHKMRRLGIDIKIITGDNAAISRQVARLLGIREPRIMSGDELDLLHSDALATHAPFVDVFAQVDPNQKERIILALKHRGDVVGYMGDGINDLAAIHAADASISVEDAVDAAKAAADFVLLEKDLGLLTRGVLEGRRSFANTMKYILMTTSANLGNMFSMAIASLALPFLPLLAGQILLNNFLSDIPAMGLAEDTVDQEVTERPLRWDLRGILKFMLLFGLLSSIFDILTFTLLRLVFHTDTAEFRTAWFVESLMTELIVALLLRTRRRFYLSRPSVFLLGSTLIIAVLAFLIPYIPWSSKLGFTPLPARLLFAIVGITCLYALVTEMTKLLFFKPVHDSTRAAGHTEPLQQNFQKRWKSHGRFHA
jgi:Mg2+-importing ATPase